MTATLPTTRATATATPRRAAFGTAVLAVATGQLARARVARAPLLFVATLQSVGILLLLRGVIGRGGAGGPDVVAGSVVLVVGFVGLNLLAQRLGTLRASRALDYYAALRVPPAAVVLGTAASYAAFTVPGALITAAVGVGCYGLPPVGIAMAVPCAMVAAVPLAGVGATLGLLLPRAELATIAGQLGMTAVLFLGVIPVAHLPELLRGIRLAVPGMLAVDALADTLQRSVHWGYIALRLAASVGYGAVALAAASAAFRRAVSAA